MDTSKKIWYINHYATPPQYDTHLRTVKFLQYLTEAGYDVTIFASSIIHNKNVDLIPCKGKYLEKKYGTLKYVHIKTIKYRNSWLLRIYSLIQFSFRIFFLKKHFGRPDIIIHTAHIPFENFLYYLSRRLKSQYVVEILDLWPESFVAYGIISRKNPLLSLGYMAEKWLYSKADNIIFSMEGGRDYIIERGWNLEKGGPIDLSKVHFINNGVDLEEFEENKNKYRIEDSDLMDDSTFRVVYLGSIRLVNNLKLLIDAAAILINNKKIKFLIYGDGSERNELEEYCKTKGIDNVLFKQTWIELKYVPYVLSRSSLNIINHKPSDILRYGGSQGKLFQYLASGKPICSNQKMGYCLIEKNNIGISKCFNSAEEYSDAILSFAQLEKSAYDNICRRVLKVAEDYDFKVLSDALIKIIESN